jgi:hypothetical protein
MKRHASTTTVVVAASALAALAVAAGCRPDFAPYNRLTSLRVLAIQSDPPTPATGETAMLSALVFQPADDPAMPTNPAPPPVTYAWSWCPFPGPATGGHACLVTEDQVSNVAGPTAQVPPFDLGAGTTAMLPNSIDPAVFASLCAGVPGIPQAPDCTGGFPVQVALTVSSLDENNNPTEVDAVFTVRFRFDTDGSTTANSIPRIHDLTAAVAPPPTDPRLPPLIPDPTVGPVTGPITLPRDTETDLGAELELDASQPTEAFPGSETYPGVDANGNPATLTENLFLTWFVETGGTKYSRTSYIESSPSLFDLRLNTWSPARSKDYPKNDARIYVVVHDSRGGVSWKEGIVHLESTP